MSYVKYRILLYAIPEIFLGKKNWSKNDYSKMGLNWFNEINIVISNAYLAQNRFVCLAVLKCPIAMDSNNVGKIPLLLGQLWKFFLINTPSANEGLNQLFYFI